MTRVIRSRRAGLSRDQARQQPLYARTLGLQYLTPSGFLCFVFFEGTVALGVLLALAELVSWWGVLVLPITVAAMVKLNDVVAGAVSRPVTRAARRPPTTSAAPRVDVAQTPVALLANTPSAAGAPMPRTYESSRASVVGMRSSTRVPDLPDATALNGPPVARQWSSPTEQVDNPHRWARQAASRRYE